MVVSTMKADVIPKAGRAGVEREHVKAPIIVAFHSLLVWLGCGSSLTSQHFGCPVSLNLGDQSNSAL